MWVWASTRDAPLLEMGRFQRVGATLVVAPVAHHLNIVEPLALTLALSL